MADNIVCLKIMCCLQLLTVTHLKTTEHHLSYKITRYLPSNTGERVPRVRQSSAWDTYSTGMEGWVDFDV